MAKLKVLTRIAQNKFNINDFIVNKNNNKKKSQIKTMKLTSVTTFTIESGALVTQNNCHAESRNLSYNCIISGKTVKFYWNLVNNTMFTKEDNALWHLCQDVRFYKNYDGKWYHYPFCWVSIQNNKMFGKHQDYSNLLFEVNPSCATAKIASISQRERQEILNGLDKSVPLSDIKLDLIQRFGVDNADQWIKTVDLDHLTATPIHGFDVIHQNHNDCWTRITEFNQSLRQGNQNSQKAILRQVCKSFNDQYRPIFYTDFRNRMFLLGKLAKVCDYNGSCFITNLPDEIILQFAKFRALLQVCKKFYDLLLEKRHNCYTCDQQVIFKLSHVETKTEQISYFKKKGCKCSNSIYTLKKYCLTCKQVIHLVKCNLSKYYKEVKHCGRNLNNAKEETSYRRKYYLDGEYSDSENTDYEYEDFDD